MNANYDGTGMVRHLTLTALEIQRDHTTGGAVATHLIFLTRRSEIGVTE